MKTVLLAGAAALLLSACNQESAPSDEVEKAAEDIVDVAQGVEPTPLASGPYAPHFECDDLEGAADFRQKLALAVEARDTSGFVALAADDIKLDFGGGSGAVELRNRLTAENSNLWKELDELLVLGCAANAQGGMTIPWYFEQEISGDAMTTMIVTGQDIPLISADTGKPLDRISWNSVTLVDGYKPEAPFQLVSYSGGAEGKAEEGYVATPMLRSAIDYRLIASRRNGKWSITSFIAGD